MKNSPKLAILQSLDFLDQMQMENVLNYIKGLLPQQGHMDQKNLKKEAMKEIRQALKQYKRPKSLQLIA